MPSQRLHYTHTHTHITHTLTNTHSHAHTYKEKNKSVKACAKANRRQDAKKAPESALLQLVRHILQLLQANRNQMQQRLLEEGKVTGCGSEER